MENRQANSNRMVLLLIAGIPLIVVLASTWLWYFVARGDLDLVGALGTANHGELVQPPRQLDELSLYGQTGSAFPYADLEPPRWTLLIPGAQMCDSGCEELLYLTRQIHLSLGKQFNRVRRLYLSETPVSETALRLQSLSDERPVPSDFAQLLAREHRGVEALRLEAGAAERVFPEWHSDASTWYLVDPEGWVMMSYNSEISYREAIADLKFLLKNSSG